MRASSPFDPMHDPADPAWEGYALEPIPAWRRHLIAVRPWLPIFFAVIVVGAGVALFAHGRADHRGGTSSAAKPVRSALPVLERTAPATTVASSAASTDAAPTAAQLQADAAERLRVHAAANNAKAPAATSTAPLNALAAQAPSHGIDTGTATPHLPSEVAADAAWLATSYVGTPYVWAGGTPKDGFDCSGLVQFVYGVLGAELPRTTYTMWNLGRHVEKSELRQGDLVFFNGLDHMGLYVGGGKFVHAPRAGDRVKITALDDMPGWYGAVRLD